MFEQIRDILAKETGINREEISLSSNLNEDFGIDSMDYYNLMDALEKGLGLSIPDSDTIETVGELVELVSAQPA